MDQIPLGGGGGPRPQDKRTDQTACGHQRLCAQWTKGPEVAVWPALSTGRQVRGAGRQEASKGRGQPGKGRSKKDSAEEADLWDTGRTTRSATTDRDLGTRRKWRRLGRAHAAGEKGLTAGSQGSAG